MSAPVVSVVVPVYDGEAYLEQCLRSVREQTFMDFDCTVVDNCSRDRSGEIARAFAAADPRFRVVAADEFFDQVANLNRAMAAAHPQARWVKMLLADDWLFPHCLEQMVAVGERHPTVGIVGSYRLDDRTVNCDGLEVGHECFDGRQIARESLTSDLFVFGSPSTLLYRGEVVRSRAPFFRPDRLHEDTEACYEILSQWDFGFVHQVLSFTRRQNESLSSARRSIDPAHRLDRLLVTLRFGPQYLDAEEFARCRARAETAYYRFLGERTLYRTPPEFWRYHEEGLATVGATLDRWRWWRARLGAAISQLANPIRLVRRLAGFLRGRRDGNHDESRPATDPLLVTGREDPAAVSKNPLRVTSDSTGSAGKDLR